VVEPDLSLFDPVGRGQMAHNYPPSGYESGHQLNDLAGTTVSCFLVVARAVTRV